MLFYIVVRKGLRKCYPGKHLKEVSEHGSIQETHPLIPTEDQHLQRPCDLLLAHLRNSQEASGYGAAVGEEGVADNEIRVSEGESSVEGWGSTDRTKL